MFIISRINIPFDFYDFFCIHELFDSDGKLERMVQFKFLHYSWMHVLSSIFCSICFCILHTGLWAAGFHLLVICIHDIKLYLYLYFCTFLFLHFCIFELLYFCIFVFLHLARRCGQQAFIYWPFAFMTSIQRVNGSDRYIFYRQPFNQFDFPFKFTRQQTKTKCQWTIGGVLF